MSFKNVILIVIAVLAIFLASDSVYTVHETQRAILLRFGKVVEADVAPGLHFKLPIAEEVKKADGRVLTLPVFGRGVEVWDPSTFTFHPAGAFPKDRHSYRLVFPRSSGRPWRASCSLFPSNCPGLGRSSCGSTTSAACTGAGRMAA